MRTVLSFIIAVLLLCAAGNFWSFTVWGHLANILVGIFDLGVAAGFVILALEES